MRKKGEILKDGKLKVHFFMVEKMKNHLRIKKDKMHRREEGE